MTNEQRWKEMKINPGKLAELQEVAKKAIDAKSRYKTIETMTQVPWWVIAVIHRRESDQDWSRSLAQGDRWNRVSVNVPRGRGPFASFEEAAVDALVACAPWLAKWKDWSCEGTLDRIELYNGAGYRNRKMPSPYLWAGTNQYKSGKYVSDGKFSSTAVDSQPGCAGMLKLMMDLDYSIKFMEVKP